MMRRRSSPEGPPRRCLDPPISVSPSAAGCGGQDMKDPLGIKLCSAPPTGGVAPLPPGPGVRGPGGATTTSPDVTHPPQLSVKTWGVGSGGGGGGIGSLAGGGGFPRSGGLCATRYYRMHTSRGDVCLGVWGYGGMYVKAEGLHLSRGRAPNAGSSLRNKRHLYSTPSCWRSKHGWFDEREACTKKLGTVGAMPPNTAISQNPGGGGGRRQGPGLPPPPPPRGEGTERNSPHHAAKTEWRSTPNRCRSPSNRRRLPPNCRRLPPNCRRLPPKCRQLPSNRSQLTPRTP